MPEELFHAAGFSPVFVFHTPEDCSRARACLPDFTCWIAVSAFDQALGGRLDGLAGMALAQTCDALQGLADLWPRHVPRIPFFHIGMPRRLDGPSSRSYLLAELQDLRRRIEGWVGRSISDDEVRESIALYNRGRAWMRGLYARAAEFDSSDLYGCVRAMFQEPKEVWARRADWNARVADGESRPRLLVVGSALADPVLFDVIAQAGARVAGDLLDLGERYVAVDAAETGDPLEALADRLLASAPTPTKFHAHRARGDFLLALVRERRARGVVFARQKFCDPHGFEYARLAHVLSRAGVPHLLVELEQASHSGQLRTRLEAFVEMIV